MSLFYQTGLTSNTLTIKPSKRYLFMKLPSKGKPIDWAPRTSNDRMLSGYIFSSKPDMYSYPNDIIDSNPLANLVTNKDITKAEPIFNYNNNNITRKNFKNY